MTEISHRTGVGRVSTWPRRLAAAVKFTGLLQAGASGSGDLGRGIAHRRQELGLSTDELAVRCGLSAGYLEYLETHEATVCEDTVRRLAAALETTVAGLFGQRSAAPAEVGGPYAHRGEARGEMFRELDTGECRELLSQGGIGRVVVSTANGPAAFPVNYVMLGGAIVFRTAAGSALAGVRGGRTGFEVDRVDEARREGWSVQVIGSAALITDPTTVWLLYDLVKPWAAGERDVCIRIDIHRMTGRHVHAAPDDTGAS